jgi:hypothetical protein
MITKYFYHLQISLPFSFIIFAVIIFGCQGKPHKKDISQKNTKQNHESDEPDKNETDVSIQVRLDVEKKYNFKTGTKITKVSGSLDPFINDPPDWPKCVEDIIGNIADNQTDENLYYCAWMMELLDGTIVPTWSLVGIQKVGFIEKVPLVRLGWFQYEFNNRLYTGLIAVYDATDSKMFEYRYIDFRILDASTKKQLDCDRCRIGGGSTLPKSSPPTPSYMDLDQIFENRAIYDNGNYRFEFYPTKDEVLEVKLDKY